MAAAVGVAGLGAVETVAGVDDAGTVDGVAVVVEGAAGPELVPAAGVIGVWVGVAGWLADGVVADGFAGAVADAVVAGAVVAGATDAGDAGAEAGVVCENPFAAVGAPAPVSPVFALPVGAGVSLAGG